MDSSAAGWLYIAMDSLLYRVLSVGNWSLKKTFTSRRKQNKQEKPQDELEESLKKNATLTQDKFVLEQCVRYLSSRCQMYQTIWKAREGTKKQHRRVTSLSSRYEGASTSGASGEIAEREDTPREQQQHPQEMTSVESMSSPGDDSPRLSRSLELQIINKIAQICEPFVTQFSESSSARMLSRHRSSREVSNFAS